MHSDWKSCRHFKRNVIVFIVWTLVENSCVAFALAFYLSFTPSIAIEARVVCENDEDFQIEFEQQFFCDRHIDCDYLNKSKNVITLASRKKRFEDTPFFLSLSTIFFSYISHLVWWSDLFSISFFILSKFDRSHVDTYERFQNVRTSHKPIYLLAFTYTL